MTTRDDVIAAIRGVDARMDGLRERILAAGENPLLEGTWRVRDALSHLAARANGVDRVAQRVRAAQAGTPMAPVASIDEINAGQVHEREGATVLELLDEIRAGHAAAIEAIGRLDEGTLEHPLPMANRPDPSPAIDMMLRGGPGHDQGHIDQIEAALK
jgi:hypothetical protein